MGDATGAISRLASLAKPLKSADPYIQSHSSFPLCLHCLTYFLLLASPARPHRSYRPRQKPVHILYTIATMFGFGASSSSTPPPASTPTEAPSREQRKACWDSRDTYYACINKTGVLIAGGNEAGEAACKRERAEYERHCGKSWVSAPCYPSAWSMLWIAFEACSLEREAVPWDWNHGSEMDR